MPSQTIIPIPRRVALSVGLALVRWARSQAPPPRAARSRRVRLGGRPFGKWAKWRSGGAENEPDHATRIRRYHLVRQLESEREDAMRRYLTQPRQL